MAQTQRGMIMEETLKKKYLTIRVRAFGTEFVVNAFPNDNKTTSQQPDFVNLRENVSVWVNHKSEGLNKF